MSKKHPPTRMKPYNVEYIRAGDDEVKMYYYECPVCGKTIRQIPVEGFYEVCDGKQIKATQEGHNERRNENTGRD